MQRLRELVRTSVPFSRPAYEAIDHRRRRHRSRAQISAILRSGGQAKLDIGGGYRPGSNGWLTVDTSRECDLYWDLREGIPFPDATVDAIYSSHLFEHLSFDEGQSLMRECLRALRPGATFSIAVPNARLYIEGYLGLREIPADYFAWTPAYHGTSSIDAVNYIAYMAGEHRAMFDQESLVARLRLAGFADARPRDFDPSTDLAERDYESIYAIATKPLV